MPKVVEVVHISKEEYEKLIEMEKVYNSLCKQGVGICDDCGQVVHGAIEGWHNSKKGDVCSNCCDNTCNTCE